MKYSVSARQEKKYLAQADEIIVETRDYRMISDLFIDYPDKIIILDLAIQDIFEYADILIEYAKCSDNFICRITNLDIIPWLKENGVKYYYTYPVSTWYDIQGLIDLGCEYITVMAPLTFEINKLAQKNIKFRMVPNVCYSEYIPRENGLLGQWVRPEDIQHYENGIYIFDFEDCDLKKERALFNIYTSGHWDGNMNLLFTNFNLNIDNRAIHEQLGEARANCGQKCMSIGSCHLCQSAKLFADNINHLSQEQFKQKLQEAEQNNLN